MLKHAFWLMVLCFVVVMQNESIAQVRCGDRVGPSSRPIIMDRDLQCSGGGLDKAVTLQGPVVLEMRGRTITCIGSNNDGVGMVGARAKLIGPGTIVGCEDGVTLYQPGFHTVQRLTIGPSNDTFSDGIVIFSPSNVVRFNLIRRLEGDGIKLFGDDASSNTIGGNRVTVVGGSGIRTVPFAGVFPQSNLIINNHINDTEDAGIEVASSARVLRNLVVRPGENGITVLPGTNVAKTTNARLINNTILQSNGHGVQIRGNSTRNLVQMNRVSSSRLNGILAERTASGNGFWRNRAVGSGGFDTLDRNVACGQNRWAENYFNTRNRPCIR